jgi:hypothetical protein
MASSQLMWCAEQEVLALPSWHLVKTDPGCGTAGGTDWLRCGVAQV